MHRLTRRARLFCLLISVLPIGSTWAVYPKDQYKSYLTRAQSVEPLTEFGDQISLRDGKVSFKVVDIEVPGNGPTIKIVRTTVIDDGRSNGTTSGNQMGQWELELPRLKTVTANPPPTMRAQPLLPQSPIGWQVQGPNKDARCSAFGTPGDVVYNGELTDFLNYEWWFGYQLVDLDGTEHTVFARSAEMSNAQYRIGTSDNWIISCLPNTANGLPGEGFLAISPDGTKYWLNYLVYTVYQGLSKQFENMPPKGYTLVYTLPRQAASMLVTRIEDRFGNWVNYTYAAGKITSIDASDGRKVTVNSNGYISSVVVGTGAEARTWSYAYDPTYPERLSSVTLPDSSRWSYSGNFGSQYFSPYSFDSCLQAYSAPFSGSNDLSVTSPAGATATYHFERMMFGRSFVPKVCSSPTASNPNGGYAMTPKLWIGYAITSKVITGFGAVNLSWQYHYAPATASWKQDCDAGAVCGDLVWTDVTNALGERTRSTFSNRWSQLENKLVQEEQYASNGALMRTTQYAYAVTPSNAANPFAWPLKLGSFSGFQVNEEVNLRWTPLMQRTSTQDGRAFDWKVSSDCAGTPLCFDAFARPTKIVRQSSP